MPRKPNHTGEVAELYRELDSLKRGVEQKEASILAFIKQCSHKWGETFYCPIVREGYTTQGDPPGTMGIDWRGPQYVPREEKRRWARTCSVCGYTQTTDQVRKKTGSIGNGLQGDVEEPVFS